MIIFKWMDSSSSRIMYLKWISLITSPWCKVLLCIPWSWHPCGYHLTQRIWPKHFWRPSRPPKWHVHTLLTVGPPTGQCILREHKNCLGTAKKKNVTKNLNGWRGLRIPEIQVRWIIMLLKNDDPWRSLVICHQHSCAKHHSSTGSQPRHHQSKSRTIGSTTECQTDNKHVKMW